MNKIPGAKIEKSLYSSNGIFKIKVGKVSIQIDFNVSKDEKSSELTTELLAKKLNQMPCIIRVLSPEVAFAHKLAVWAERRLIRDLYDTYFWYSNVRSMPDMSILKSRLDHYNSQIPKLKRKMKMTPSEFLLELKNTLDHMNEEDFLAELIPLIDRTVLRGLFPVFQAQLRELLSQLSKDQLWVA